MGPSLPLPSLQVLRFPKEVHPCDLVELVPTAWCTTGGQAAAEPKGHTWLCPGAPQPCLRLSVQTEPLPSGVQPLHRQGARPPPAEGDQAAPPPPADEVGAQAGRMGSLVRGHPPLWDPCWARVSLWLRERPQCVRPEQRAWEQCDSQPAGPPGALNLRQQPGWGRGVRSKERKGLRGGPCPHSALLLPPLRLSLSLRG